MDEPLLTVAEVADLLRLNQQTIRDWIDAGNLPAVRLGRRVRIRQADLEALTGPSPQPVSSTDSLATVEEHTSGTGQTLDALINRLERFRDERGWGRYHSLKDLAAGVAIEAAELQELFLWQRTEDEGALLASRRPEIEAELADVMINCLNFASVARIDLFAAFDRKINQNAVKYPVGNSEPKRWS